MSQHIIINENYQLKPYLNTTQNQQYIRFLINNDIKSACVVLVAGILYFNY